MSKHTKRGKAKLRAWMPFQRADFPKDIMDELGDHEVWLNNLYQVNVRYFDTPWGDMRQLSIKRIDRAPERDWRAFQRIKNEICGPDYEGVEIYPAERRLVDTANQYHIWVLPHGKFLPFGMWERCVSESQAGGSKQRLWDDDQRPPDLVTIEQDGDLVTVKMGDKVLEQHRMVDMLKSPS